MTEVKAKKVTFDAALPRGTCATFTHEGQRWIAYPQAKVVAIGTVIDRMLGTIDRLGEGLVQWINTHPEDAVQVMRLMTKSNSAKELAMEKVQTWTM